MKTKVVIGNKYGKLTPIEVIGKNKNGLLLYNCLCDCGNIKVVGSRYLTEGKITSCGCARKKSKGKSNSITYKSWISAKQRCLNPNNHNYKNYGRRGIKMCEKWINSFVAFLEDMGERPSSNHTLDRIDNNGNYEKSNCRWATKREQSNNTRTNRLIKINDKEITVSEFSRKYGINISNVFYELKKGMNPKDIIEKYKNR